MDIDALTHALVRFRDERDWAQFHTLRNLIVSLNLEAAELLELTQWKSDAEMAALPEDAAGMEALRDECADVLLYLLQIAERGGFDLLRAAAAKLEKNALKYPVEKCLGSSRKYTELD
ncbi:nucleotide pyrophosphohydrolase [Propionivibrio sp.]|jgi:NTP pyrophosphatase (non-canonical NTP hydrolase)|uniref:nucleotide pyrophosphohydrolase n=1 Tax=Propionivibrio sp. TaxID=2212460 RepID=UPI0039E5AD44